MGGVPPAGEQVREVQGLSGPMIPSDHYLEINGLNIHYLDWEGGSDRNLLLVHGQGGNAHNWDEIARRLRGEFRVIAVDLRGHG